MLVFVKVYLNFWLGLVSTGLESTYILYKILFQCSWEQQTASLRGNGDVKAALKRISQEGKGKPSEPVVVVVYSGAPMASFRDQGRGTVRGAAVLFTALR